MKVKSIGQKVDRREAGKIHDQAIMFAGSQRMFSKKTGIPRTTLQHWGNRHKKIDLPSKTVDFMEGEEGQIFLHKLFIALLFLHTKGNASLRDLAAFLKNSQLDHFIASSKSSLHRNAIEMEEHIISFAKREREKMAEAMPEKEISVAQDETFPCGICLVAIEPVSNFILLERLVENRKTATWNHCMAQAMDGLPVKVTQAVGDQAQSLIKHATEGLNAHHSPDTFHIQQELTKAASSRMKLAVKRSKEALKKQEKKVAKCIRDKTMYDELPIKPRGRPPNFDARIMAARTLEMRQVDDLRKELTECEMFHESRRRISKIYHPYSLETGLPQSPGDVENKLEKSFDEIEEVTKNLGDISKKRVKKARKQVGAMKATILFFFMSIAAHLDNLRLDSWSRMLLEDFLIPACYLRIAASKIKDKELKSEIENLYRHIMVDYTSHAGPFSHYSANTLKSMLKSAEECATIFQRSSSAVEGRNGQLALKHHTLHRLSNRKLACLTAIHNFDTRRNDGSTPAERFFESSHPDLFKHLIHKMQPCGRPRIRKKSAKAA